MTYERFTWPMWKGQGNPETGLIEDAVLGPFVDGLREAKIGVQVKELNKVRNEIIRDPKWTWDQTKEFTREVWAHILPAQRDRYDSMHARFPTDMLPDGDAPHMTSGGHCGDEGIKFRCDGSLSDPVYMAHESGHLMALGQADHARRNVVELQAFFGQEAAYGYLIGKGEPLAKQARIHRLDEYSRLTMHINQAVELLGEHKDAEGHSKEDSALWYMHGHPFAGLVIISAYKNFKQMSPAQKAAALEVLYEGGSQTTYHDILGTFGVDDMRKAGLDAANHLRDEAKALGFWKAPEAKATPGSKPTP